MLDCWFVHAPRQSTRTCTRFILLLAVVIALVTAPKSPLLQPARALPLEGKAQDAGSASLSVKPIAGDLGGANADYGLMEISPASGRDSIALEAVVEDDPAE